MFYVIYSFDVKKGKESAFEKAWGDLTKLIFKHCGSNGSRLHKSKGQEYIAYAAWPNKKLWENGFAKLPDAANVHSKQMKECCAEIKTVYELNLLNDLLKN